MRLTIFFHYLLTIAVKNNTIADKHKTNKYNILNRMSAKLCNNSNWRYSLNSRLILKNIGQSVQSFIFRYVYFACKLEILLLLPII